MEQEESEWVFGSKDTPCVCVCVCYEQLLEKSYFSPQSSDVFSYS